MNNLIRVTLFLFACVQVITLSEEADVGTALSYDPPYTPNRCHVDGDQFPSGNLFIAVSEGLWDNGAACGRRYRVKCLSGGSRRKGGRSCKDAVVDVRVVDHCHKTPCPATIMFSNDAFSAISKFQTSKLNVEYVQI